MTPTPWHARRMGLFDLETTGTDPHRDRIVTAAVISAGGGEPTTELEWLVNPGIPIPASASEVHGVTDEQAQSGQSADVAVADIALAVIKHSAEGLPVVGHNIAYDLTMLHAELLRHNLTSLAKTLLGLRPVVDTMVIEKSLDPYRPGKPNGRRPDEMCGKHTLVECCRLWGVPLSEDDAHGAAADALAAGRLAWKLATQPGRFEPYGGPKAWERISPGEMGLGELHDWQAGRYAQEAKRFQSYQRGEQRNRPDAPDPEFVAATGWPFQEHPMGWSPTDLPTAVA